MIANYHTHTFRCHHATETEREYIEAAIAAGLKTLGFSDHVPMPFEDGHQTRYRVRIEELPDYIETLTALREEYRGRIEILIGFEAEYYPLCFDNMMKLLGQYKYDYLILGQHYSNSETDGKYATKPTDDPALLRGYVDQVLEGLGKGVFTYIAHPDIWNYTPDDDIYRAEMTRLCRGCLEMGIPLELNCLGIKEGRSYPCDKFFRIVSEVGNDVVLGCDAHHLVDVANAGVLEKSRAFAARFGITPVETVNIRNPIER